MLIRTPTPAFNLAAAEIPALFAPSRRFSAAARDLRLQLPTPAESGPAPKFAAGVDSMRTLKASLLASAVGTGAWLLGVADKVWPAHPMWAVFFLTMGVLAFSMYAFAHEEKQRAQ